jgi:hypothetical protein
MLGLAEKGYFLLDEYHYDPVVWIVLRQVIRDMDLLENEEHSTSKRILKLG